jgi:predicted O-methyltransferase YrrM
VSEEWTNVARRHWEKAGVSSKVELRLGPAVESLHKLEGEGAADTFDFAFIDANKEDYDAYYESALRLVRTGGVVAVDNTLRLGRVADPDDHAASVSAVRVLNAKIAGDERVDRVMVPIADGMILARRR